MNRATINTIVGLVLLCVFVLLVLWLNRARGKHDDITVLEALNLGYLTGKGDCDGDVDNEESGEEWNKANPGSKFRARVGGKCPRDTYPVDARHGVWKDFCITKKAKKAQDYSKKNPGSIFEKKPGKKCPRGTFEIPNGRRKGKCVNLSKKVLRKYKYWGWGGNEGLRCLYNDNTGCNTKWVDGMLVEITDEDAVLERKYPFWGWGPNEGRRCLYNDNTGCNTHWENGRLAEGVEGVASQKSFFGAWVPSAAAAPADAKKDDANYTDDSGRKVDNS